MTNYQEKNTMALFNYRVGEPVDSIPGVSRVPHYPVLRYGLHGDLKIAVFATSFQAEQAKHALINETGEMALISRNEAINDIRGLFLGDKRLKIDLSALPHLAQATKPQDVAITIALAEMTKALNQLELTLELLQEARQVVGRAQSMLDSLGQEDCEAGLMIRTLMPKLDRLLDCLCESDGE
jgi:hypothetical protein